MTVSLTSPVTLNAGQQATIDLLVSINDLAVPNGFTFKIEDSLAVVARDISSGLVITVSTDPSAGLAQSVFPIVSNWIDIMIPASPPEVCMTGLAPSIVGVGLDQVSLISTNISLPANSGQSSYTIESFEIAVIDRLGSPLDPTRLFDRIGYTIDGGAISYTNSVTTLGGALFYQFGSGITLTPGDNLDLILIADMDSDSPYDHFVLQVASVNALVARDATDTASILQPTISPQCLTTGILIAGPTDIVGAAGQPIVSFIQTPMQIAFAGQNALTTVNLNLSYPAEQGLGNLLLQGLAGAVYHRTANGSTKIDPSEIFSVVSLYDDTTLLAVDSLLVSEAIDLTIDGGELISQGGALTLRLVCDVSGDAAVGNYFVQFEDSLFLNLIDDNFVTVVFPVLSEGEYPIQSSELSIVPPSLENSSSNYPNPFVPSRGELTTFVYVLAENAYVDIDLFSTTGDRIVIAVDNVFKAAGSHQTDSWDGLNGSGHKVAPGVYFCRITARYESGRTEEFTRRVAVVR